jgi:hypothetical protein
MPARHPTAAAVQPPLAAALPGSCDKPTPFPTNFWFVKPFKVSHKRNIGLAVMHACNWLGFNISLLSALLTFLPFASPLAGLSLSFLKVGSSTISGVMRSICAHYNVLPFNVKYASLYSSASMLAEAVATTQQVAGAGATYLAFANHGPFSVDKAALLGKPLLFTAVRQLLPRVYSQFIQDHCAKLTDAGLPCLADSVQRRWEYVSRNGLQNALFKYIKGSTKTVEAAAAQYDFIFVNERMPESMVAFMLKYGLSFRWV